MMKKDRQQKIEQLIETTFKNVAELNEMLKKSDYDWANKMVNSDGDVYDNNGELAESILNVGDNLVDYGKMFRS
jgi:Na+/phosphate symporter